MKCSLVVCSALVLLIASPVVMADVIDAQQMPQKKVEGTNAGGGKQVTIIDDNGNLKIVDKKKIDPNNPGNSTNQSGMPGYNSGTNQGDGAGSSSNGTFSSQPPSMQPPMDNNGQDQSNGQNPNNGAAPIPGTGAQPPVIQSPAPEGLTPTDTKVTPISR